MISGRTWIPWTLVVLLLVAAPVGIFHASFSASPTPDPERLLQLERDNAELRGELAALGEALRELRDRAAAPASPETGQGPNGSAAPEAEHVDVLERWPVPDRLGFADEVVPLDDPAIYARVEDEWARFLVNRHWLISWLRRSRDVFPVVEARLAAAGLPDDLKYVVVVESGLRARAYSSAGAVGYWQFIRATGERYGLERNAWRDDRRNLESSTGAAIAYLSELYEEFGSWPLALAGFNAGEVRVRGSIEEQGTSNYYEMVLPSETEAYWFRAVVLKELLGHRDRYDLHLPDDGWQPTATRQVTFRVQDTRLDLKAIAAATGLSYRRLKSLNPELRRSWLPRGRHEIVLPQAVVAQFLEAFPEAELVRAAEGNATSSGADAALSEPESSTSPRP